ncbi:MAG: bifunctional demethylmenaquinone methyltransferase/2-methoxy-6-polyprenyl-1,4-benzoquinol methylase UbiE [Thermodesulfobacteriota bacterium]|nr:bifunctional demethylmenaquinone methyltransferase/2-methoxy-6-polyprenyl-1,4-benzoquinol methylase UbiE [Thermodesulfobacteriota bacterium]
MAKFDPNTIDTREKSRLIRGYFNSVALKYDMMNTLLSFGIHHIWKKIAVRMLSLNDGDKVLDVCGGTGDLAVLADKAVRPQGDVTLYDFSRAMINAGRFKKNNLPLRKRIQYIQGDVQQLSFQDDSFDAAMVGFGIRNVMDMKTGFKEMYRVLKPGGKMMCLEFSKPVSPLFRLLYNYYSFQVIPLLGKAITGSVQAYTHLPESIRAFPLPYELKAILQDIGFFHVTYRKLTNGIAVIHLAKKI